MLLEQLKLMNHFSPTEQVIAKYILDNGESVSYMTIQDLAKETYSSNVTIIRLCKKLGCEGFKDFKIRYIKELESAKDYNYLDMSRPFYMGEGPSKIMGAMQMVYAQTIQTVVNSVNVADLEKAANLMVNAKHVFVYGIGDSDVRGRSFINKLVKLKVFAVNTMAQREEISISMNSSSDDVSLFISYSGIQPSFSECVKFLKKNHCPIITITAKDDTLLAKNSDILIKIPDKENFSDSIGTFYSQISFEYILDTLYALMYSVNYAKNHENKRMIDAYNYFQKYGIKQ